MPLSPSGLETVLALLDAQKMVPAPPERVERFGTITSANGFYVNVRVDGDSDSIPANSNVTGVVEGNRVRVVFEKPHGVFISANLGSVTTGGGGPTPSPSPGDSGYGILTPTHLVFEENFRIPSNTQVLAMDGVPIVMELGSAITMGDNSFLVTVD